MIGVRIYKSVGGNPLLHVAKEDFGLVYAGYVVPKISPYLKRMNSIILRMVEAGFRDKWQSMDSESVQSLDVECLTTVEVLTINHLQSVFYLLFLGLCVSIACFIKERSLDYKCSSVLEP